MSMVQTVKRTLNEYNCQWCSVLHLNAPVEHFCWSYFMFWLLRRNQCVLFIQSRFPTVSSYSAFILCNHYSRFS